MPPQLGARIHTSINTRTHAHTYTHRRVEAHPTPAVQPSLFLYRSLSRSLVLSFLNYTHTRTHTKAMLDWLHCKIRAPSVAFALRAINDLDDCKHACSQQVVRQDKSFVPSTKSGTLSMTTSFALSHKVRGHAWDLASVVDACRDGVFLCRLLRVLEKVPPAMAFGEM